MSNHESNPNMDVPRLDLQEVRERLAGQTGQRYWRTLEEIADTPQFQQWVEDEFPNRSTLLQLNRRDLLKFMGASMALAGLTGCRSVFLGQDKVVPYVKQPEELIPGIPLYYASSIPLRGFATGVVVEQHEGRPIKLEGNPLHSASLGAIDVFTQAEILNLYDPERTGTVLQDSEPVGDSPDWRRKPIHDISTWELFAAAIPEALKASKGIRVLTGAVTSPTLVEQIDTFIKKHPGAKWHAYEPISRRNVYAGSRLAFGETLDVVYRLDRADVIVALDGDFLAPESTPGSLKYARDFANKRRVEGTTGSMSRMYAVESTPSLTGVAADHRWTAKSSEIHGIAVALAAAVGVPGVSGGNLVGVPSDHFTAMATDLLANRGKCLVVTGEHQSPEVHALVHAINSALGNVGSTVELVPPADKTAEAAGIGELKAEIEAGQVDFLVIVGGNPAFDAPADLNMADAIASVRHSVFLTREKNETGKVVEWELPLTHPLEEWGDARAFDGTVSIIQPLIAPIFESKSAIEVFSILNGKPVNGYDLVRSYWKRTALAGGDFEAKWRTFLHDGVLADSAFASLAPRAAAVAPGESTPVSGLELNFRPDPGVFDGRYANNGWLQELPNPINKVTWDNVASMSLKTAQTLGVVDDDIVRIEANGGVVDATVFIQPGQADQTVAVTLGYGRTVGGSVATATGKDGGGFNAFALRATNALSWTSATVAKVGGHNDVASTQGHNPLGGNVIGDERDILREASLAQFLRDPEEVVPWYAFPEEDIKKNNLYVEEVFEWNGEKWGMTIDLNVCIGCNACVTACQAENNIPVVGKDQVNRNREMHWLRIDRYYKGDGDSPQLTWQPIACVHCEAAPCEPVCPVAATVHSHDGLNMMVYNRCVGTRYCSNNCPYKVRRFNYLNYTDNQPNFMDKVPAVAAALGNTTTEKTNGIQLLKMLNNPDVTVRGRGVMEKCTYCVQRINDARKESKKLGKPLKDGDIVTACQQACPTQAIVFGDTADKESRVAKLRKDPRAWMLLEELQTRPMTSHLAKLRNPNPAITPTPPPDPNKAKKKKHHGDESHGDESHGGETHSTDTVKTDAAHAEGAAH